MDEMIISGNAKNNWGSRFRDEIDLHTEIYEKLNKEAKTIIRKITQEEIDAYNQLNKVDYNKLNVKRMEVNE